MASYEWPPEGSGSGSGVIVSINGDTTPAQLIVGGTGISVATAGGTTTITNTSTGPTGTGTDKRIVRWNGTSNIQDSLVTIDDTGHIISTIAGTPSAVALCFNSDVDTGFVSTGSNELSTYAGANLITKEFSTGFAWFQPGTPANFIQNTIAGGSATFAGTNVNGWVWTSAATSNTNFQIINTSSGALGWSLSALGSANGDYLGGINLVSDRSGANPVIQVRKFDQIILGGNSGVLTSNSVVLADRPQTTITGTTTANAATSITITSGLAIQQLSPGDRIALSSASSTFATVLTVVSNTSITVDTALGNGTSQTISRLSGCKWVDGTAAFKAILTDQGRLGLGIVNPASKLHLDAGVGVGSVVRMTVGATTGQTNTDGFIIGVDLNAVGQIRNYENQPVLFFTNNTQRGAWSAGGNFCVSPALQTGASLIHVDAGTATASNLRFTANATTGQTSGDGLTFGIKTNGEGLIQQNENLQITVRNNGLDTARFTQYNSLSFTEDGTTHFFDTATEINVSRDLTVTAASGFHAAISVIPQVSSDTDNTCTYYGLAMEPSLIGVNGFAEGYGSLFGVDNQTSGTSGQLAGLRLSISNSGGGTVTDSFAGLTVTAENNVGSVPFIYGVSATTANGATVAGPVYAGRFAAAAGGTATDLISMIATEPVDSSSGGMSGLIAAAYVDGTLAIKQSDSAATGAINSLTIISSHMHMTGNPTINGIDPVNHTAHFLIITCSAGMTITDQSGSATTASGRIITGSGLSIVVVGDGAVMIKRDITNSRWRVVSAIT